MKDRIENIVKTIFVIHHHIIGGKGYMDIFEDWIYNQFK